MKLAIDARCVGPERITGVGVYAQNLLRALVNLMEPTPVELWLPWRKRQLSARIQERLGSSPQIYTELTRLFAPPDLVFGPDFKCPRFGSFKKVITIHDVVEFEPEFKHTKFMDRARINMTNTIKRNRPDHIIAATDFTKDRILAAYPNLQIPISKVYHGVDHFDPVDKALHQSPHPRPYFVCVGTIETRKNQLNAVRAYKIFKTRNPDSNIDLVLIGAMGPGSEQVQSEIKEGPFEKNIYKAQSLPHSQVANYYGFAEAKLFPSLYEGFGFPILEAMRSSTPVITSNFGAMKEIAGEAALLTDPRNPLDIAEKMEYLLKNKSVRMELIEKGLRHAQSFTWKKCAEDTLAVFEETLKQAPHEN